MGLPFGKHGTINLTTVLLFNKLIDGCVYDKMITLEFGEHFAQISSNNSNRITERLAAFYCFTLSICWFSANARYAFNVELVDSSLASSCNGKAPLLELTAEQ